ncbi:putative secreted protein [Streptomyces avermitilis MA-4680 = NBRC 14893]|uniref:Secreted protein n=2 Tax=Streptomyces avermitilis TaxID=33903 RepID=Q82EN7_STRAW|nr:putative secreted protein [Streptomyces avermitilis MA-4680 = NBRC 14893]
MMAVDSTGDPQATGAGLGAAVGGIAASGIGPFAGVGAAAAQVLRVEGETLTAFKKRVDDLLTQLEESKAAPRRIADGALPTGRLGNFDEADALHAAYTRVHSQLEQLSQMLALQIEGLVVTVDASKAGYHDLDDDVRDRLSRIRVEADELLADRPGPGAENRTSRGVGRPSGDQQGSQPPDAEAGGL